MKISVIIPTKDRPRELRRCLRSILALTRVPDEIIVVDASESPTLLTEENYLGQLPLVHKRCDPGLTAQKNLGASMACGDVLVFLDDDVVLEESYIEEIEKEFQNDPELGGITGWIENFEDDRFLGINSLVRKVLFSKSRNGRFTSYGLVKYVTAPFARQQVEFMSGGNSAVRRRVWQESKFDENLKGYAICEDEDFSLRVARRHKIVFTPKVRLHHFQRQLSPSDHRVLSRSLIINRHYLYKKNFSQTMGSRVGFNIMVCGILLHRLGNGNWSGARGVIEGYLSIKRIIAT